MSHKIPAEARLHREYLAGATYGSLAKKYDVHPRSVRYRLKREAEAAGLPWPLKKGRPGWEARKAAAVRRERHDSVIAIGVRDEILECSAKYRITFREIAERAKISQTVIYYITARDGYRISRRTANRIMRTIQRIQYGEITPTRRYTPPRKQAA